MGSSLTRLLVFLSIFAAIALKSNSQYLLPITKHEPTNLFYTTFNVGSAAKSPVNLLLDLGTNLTWLDCRKLKSLSSLRLVTCQSSTCKSIPELPSTPQTAASSSLKSPSATSHSHAPVRKPSKAFLLQSTEFWLFLPDLRRSRNK
ncbi:unnamed protein product [Arabidopsis thaliana]|uniref:(thale cress) hypothetical protein n=1 Tax=Arabidopsis thaliana TaxID=3702 RepID=A0A7G2F8X1_ARATH|nr:unnamed protein product [Arabidopsis thaliana]